MYSLKYNFIIKLLHEFISCIFKWNQINSFTFLRFFFIIFCSSFYHHSTQYLPTYIYIKKNISYTVFYKTLYRKNMFRKNYWINCQHQHLIFFCLPIYTVHDHHDWFIAYWKLYKIDVNVKKCVVFFFFKLIYFLKLNIFSRKGSFSFKSNYVS